MKYKTYILAVCYALIVGLSPLVVKLALGYTNSTLLVSHRFLIAAIVILTITWKKENYKLKEFIQLIPLSFLFPILLFTLQAEALKTADTIQIGIIQANVPLVAAIGSYFIWKDRLTLKQWAYIILSTCGIIYIFTNVGVSRGLSIGIIFSILATFTWGMYSVVVKKYLIEMSSIKISAIIITNAALIYGGYALVTQKNYIQPLTNINYVGCILFLSILATVVSIISMVYITNKLGAGRAMVFNHLATLITILSGVIILYESLYYYHIIGIIIVLLSLIQLNRGQNDSKT